MGLDRALRRRSRRSCATPTTWPTASTCAATSASTPGCTAATSTRPAARWTVETDAGERVDARFLVMAIGCLSAAKLPDDPRDRDLRGAGLPHRPLAARGRRLHRQRVGVIGTGSSGIQSIPLIAEQAEHLTVFQRTPNYTVPARNAPVRSGVRGRAQGQLRAPPRRRRDRSPGGVGGAPSRPSRPPGRRREPRSAASRPAGRWASCSALLGSFDDLMLDRESNAKAVEFIRRRKIREIVDDPVAGRAARPSDHPFGSKRICVDTGYYETYNRDERRAGRSAARPRSRRSPRPACAPPTRSTSSTSSSSPPGSMP